MVTAKPQDSNDWSDATRSLLRAPTLERIERHATDLLSRALNGGRVTGFVGAGASMAYGRLSWRDLVLVNQEKVLDHSSARALVDPAIIALRALLERQKIRADGTSSSEEFLPAFQLTEQLDALLNAAPAGTKRPGERSVFRGYVADLVVDDRGHLKRILDAVLPREQGADPADAVLPDEENEDPVYNWAGLRRAECLRILCNDVDALSAGKPDVKAVTNAVKALVPNRQEFTRPYHRFAIGLLLALLPAKERRAKLANAAAKAGSKKPALRADLLPRERDPLRLMLDLRVSRFLTTNYDREIERLLAAEGYAHLSDDKPDDPGGERRTDLLASGSSDMVFDAAHTGHLFAFAAHTKRREAAVVHLHGRADRPEPLIVTEEDYQRRYLAEHGNRSLMEDSLRAAFTSSPLLFVGSGLGEDDLVRPLRQFVHDPTVGAGRIAVALLPMRSADPKKAESAAIRNLQRYGVHTVHYGKAVVRGRAEETWLGAFVDRLGTLRKSIVKDSGAAGDTAVMSESLIRAAAALKAGSPPSPDIAAALTRLQDLGEAAKIAQDIASSEPPDRLEDVEVTLFPGLCIAGELNLLKALVGLAKNSSDRFSSDGKAIANCLQGIEDSVVGAFLCARLIRVHEDWSNWRDDWLRLTEPEDPARAIAMWTRGDTTRPFRRHHVHLPDAKDIADAKARLDRQKSRDSSLIRQDNRLLRQRFDARAYSPYPSGDGRLPAWG